MVAAGYHPMRPIPSSSLIRSISAGLILAVLTGPVVLAAEPEPRSALAALERGRPLVIAHRGDSRAAPENSLDAFASAVAVGADLVELDYHHSADGVPVVCHDATLDRTTDAIARWGGAKRAVAAYPAAELRTLDVGKWFDGRTGQRLPLLTEALAVIQPDAVTLIERKAGDAATLADLLTERDLVNQVIVQSFDWDFLAELHERLPTQLLGALGPRPGRPATTSEGRIDEETFTALARTGARLLVWNATLEASSIADAHARGLRVLIYTIDDPVLARELVARGADGVITNLPALMRKTLVSPR